jgi:hypothetical protein
LEIGRVGVFFDEASVLLLLLLNTIALAFFPYCTYGRSMSESHSKAMNATQCEKCIHPVVLPAVVH